MTSKAKVEEVEVIHKEEEVLEISNKDSLFQKIDEAIASLKKTESDCPKEPKPPAVEYFFVEPFGSFKIFGNFGFGLNPYGQYVITSILFKFYFLIQPIL